MGKRIPFIFSQTITLAGNANGNIVFRGGEGEQVYIQKIAQASTIGANPQVAASFSFDISDSNGQYYNTGSTGATAADAGYSGKIDSRTIGDGNHPTILPQILHLPGNVSLTLNITETSGSTNKITVMLVGYKDLGT